MKWRTLFQELLATLHFIAFEHQSWVESLWEDIYKTCPLRNISLSSDKMQFQILKSVRESYRMKSLSKFQGDLM